MQRDTYVARLTGERRELELALGRGDRVGDGSFVEGQERGHRATHAARENERLVERAKARVALGRVRTERHAFPAFTGAGHAFDELGLESARACHDRPARMFEAVPERVTAGEGVRNAGLIERRLEGREKTIDLDRAGAAEPELILETGVLRPATH